MSEIEIEKPFPVEGIVEYESEDTTGYSLPCASVWLSEHESGDILKRLREEMQTHHDPGVKGEFIVYEDGTHEIQSVEPIQEADA